MVFEKAIFTKLELSILMERTSLRSNLICDTHPTFFFKCDILNCDYQRWNENSDKSLCAVRPFDMGLTIVRHPRASAKIHRPLTKGIDQGPYPPHYMQ